MNLRAHESIGLRSAVEIDEVPEIIGGVPVQGDCPQPGGRTWRQFVKGPIDWRWLSAAGSVGRGSSAFAVGVCIHYLAGKAGCRTAVLGHKATDEAGLSRRAATHGLLALEAAGLVTVQRGPGKAPRVTIQEVP